MSYWDGDWRWPKRAPKRAPPERGIKAKKAGATWWGKRWIDALERLSREYSNRLPRGRTYARAGRVHDVVVKPGQVAAKVTGSRAKPYVVRLTLGVLGDGVWSEAIAAMAREARFAAELLAGEMPRDVDSAFAALGASLFPSADEGLESSCSCPDWANPCKHVAAVHFVLGEAFDRDPFVLFELRGRSKSDVLQALRAARGIVAGEQERAAEPAGVAPARRARGDRGRRRTRSGVSDVPRPASVSLADVPAAAYGRAANALPSLALSFATARTPGSLLTQLGAPPAWSNRDTPAEALGPAIRAAAERARAWASADAATTSAAAAEPVEPEPGPRQSKRRR